MRDPKTKCGLVAVLGAPNAGKSTLVNQLVGQKVAITSAKAQTTRARMLGIALHKSDDADTTLAAVLLDYYETYLRDDLTSGAITPAAALAALEPRPLPKGIFL